MTSITIELPDDVAQRASSLGLFTPDKIRAWLMRLILDTNVVISGLLWRGPSAQLIDLAVLAAALVARADLIVSGDNDLRVLRVFEGIPIVNAVEALALLDQAAR